ncbi:hypothetical protein VN97_g9936 [Penicillium thymicola]|uniref:Uncharacterized protein n=1 Tax=Penicillium thymicola TaxID=293382 RepID=A0AAI9TAA2_PENTH|nr:hypothetical protein VN97_g9936 [Penicillium thymicola]
MAHISSSIFSVISQVSNAGPVIGRGHKSTVTLVPRRPERIEVLIERWEWIGVLYGILTNEYYIKVLSYIAIGSYSLLRRKKPIIIRRIHYIGIGTSKVN